MHLWVPSLGPYQKIFPDTRSHNGQTKSSTNLNVNNAKQNCCQQVKYEVYSQSLDLIQIQRKGTSHNVYIQIQTKGT